MVKKFMGAVALAAAMVGGAQAAIVTVGAGQSVVFNFGNAAAPIGATSLYLSGFVGLQGETGTITYYSGLNLAGTVIYVDNDPSFIAGVDFPSDVELLDPFSILISITAGSFQIDPVVNYLNATNAPVGGNQVGTVGNTSGLPVTPPTAGNVPEPGSLALVSLASLGLIATRRRRA